MSIGLFDDDIFKYGQVPFNLELMKISSYYKAKREIVVLSRTLEPRRYSKFFFRKDYYDGTYPSEIVGEKNVEVGGYAFNENQYIPLDVEIEARAADKSIYKKYVDFFIKNKETEAAFKSMYNATHLRLSLDGTQIFDKYEQQILEEKNKAFFIHDLNTANIEGARRIIEDFRSMGRGKETVRIGIKFPIKIYDFPTLKEWTSFPTMENYYPIHYYGFLADEQFVELFKIDSKNILKQFTYYPFFKKDPKEVGKKVFIQMNYGRALGRPIQVKATQTIWEDIFQFLNEYTTSSMGYNQRKALPYFTPYNYVKLKKKYLKQQIKFLRTPLSIEEIRTLFSYLQKEDYEFFKLLYECAYSKFENGRLIPCLD